MKRSIIQLFTLCLMIGAMFSFGSCNREICDNSCIFNNDGECDDGGEGSVWDEDQPVPCDFGTDCNDCGVRNSKDRP